MADNPSYIEADAKVFLLQSLPSSGPACLHGPLSCYFPTSRHAAATLATHWPPSQTHLACLRHRLLVLYGVREIEMFWDDGMHKLQATYPLFTS